jgi:hypothetical protein
VVIVEDGYFHAGASPAGSGERASVTSVSVASYRRFSVEYPTTPNYSLNYARSRSNSCSASTAPLARFDLAAPIGAILKRYDFHGISRAAGPGLTSCEFRPEDPDRAAVSTASWQLARYGTGRKHDE